jgi:hypothetical protein
MQTITTIGLDIAKSVFRVHGIDAEGKVVIRRQLKRRYVVLPEAAAIPGIGQSAIGWRMGRALRCPAALQRFRVARFDIARMQRAMVERNGRIAMRYATRTMNPKPNIARMAVKLGDFSSTKTAGSSVIKARIFVPIQSSIASSAGPNRPSGIGCFDFVKTPSLRPIRRRKPFATSCVLRLWVGPSRRSNRQTQTIDAPQ